MKTALITGVAGQDGSYLAEYLLEKDYAVVGMVRRSSVSNTANLNLCLDRIDLRTGDLCDSSSILNIIDEVQPDEIYNLGAMSHVGVSFDQPRSTFDSVGGGALNILEACRRLKFQGKIYQASSSEMFGNVEYGVILDENSPFTPRSPYACAKLYAHNMMIGYRNYDLKTYCGILFNHESPRRSENFVTRKITRYVHRLLHDGRKKVGKLHLGNINSCRDFGYAPEYVKAMHSILQLEEPTELVISTNRVCSIKDFLAVTFQLINENWQDYVVIDESLKRPNDVTYLHGDCSKAASMIGWKPKMFMENIAKEMLYKEGGK